MLVMRQHDIAPFSLWCDCLGFWFYIWEMLGQFIVILKTSKWKESSGVMSGCTKLSTNQNWEGTEGVKTGVNEVNGDEWTNERKTVPEIYKECQHCFIHILTVSYRSVSVFLGKIWFMFPFYARMSVHISILTLPSSALCGSNHSSIKPQPWRYKLS